MKSILEDAGWMRRPAAAYALLAVLLWSMPLLNVLHAESSAVIAFGGFFLAGLTSMRLFAENRALGYIVSRQLLLLAVPWSLLTVSLIWRHNCGYGLGVLFFLLFVPFSVIFAVSLASVLDVLPIRRRKSIFVATGLGIALGGAVLDIGFHSQFYTYNHVYGAILGPIYDEELTIRAGLIAFRGLTLLWALLLMLTGRGMRRRYWRPAEYAAASLLSLAILLMYVFTAPLGINTPAWYAQKELGGHRQTAHFDIYYDPDAVNEETLRLIVDEHEFRYANLKEKLGIDVGQRIQSYIYPDPDTKDRLTGARTTSVAPVWLRQPQMHILLDHFDAVFAHELAHVFSREFGLPVIRASLSVGLVEGLAVALEPSDGRPSPHEQVLTASTADTRADASIQIDAGLNLRGRLSPFGFWTGRGAVSYTSMGSFVRFLGDAYGFDRVMRVYAYGDFEAVYGKTIDELVSEWEAFLLDRKEVDRSSYAYVTRRFSIPSIFEKVCPHYVPPAVRNLRDAAKALAAGDTLRTVQYLDASLAEEPAFQDALDAWAQLKLAMNQPDTVVARLEMLVEPASEAETPIAAGIWLRLGDALALRGEEPSAVEAYARALDRLPLYTHQQRGLLAIRQVLAGQPAWIRLLSISNAASDTLDTMATDATDLQVAILVRGLLQTVDENYAPALDALESVDLDAFVLTIGQRNAIRRLLDILIVHLRYRTGDIEGALEKAESLEASFASVGAFNEAAQYADFAAKMRYIRR